MIFITGGNQGAHAINLTVANVLPELVKIGNVFHQCGYLQTMGDFERLEKAREKLSPTLKKRYHVKKYLNADEMASFLNQADLVVARSGANNTTEIAALGKPALFIPMPWNYKEEQTANAKMLVEIGLAEIVPQVGFDLSDKAVLETIKKMLGSLKNYEKNAAQAQKLVRRDAAQRVVDEVVKLV